MKIAVTATGKELTSDIELRFGRAPYFIIVDPDTMAYEVVENIQNLDLPQGAGIQAGKTIVEKGVDVLITGNCGPKAYKVLGSAGVTTMIGAKGTVESAISDYRKGLLEKASGPNVEGHWV